MKRLLTALLAAVCLAALSSCAASSGMSEDEIRETYRTLVEASYELNGIYYGDGLPYEADIDMMAYLTGAGAAALRVSYMPVAEDAAYQSEAEIRSATEKVFTDQICEHLFTLALQGISAGDENETVSYARYIEQDGVLTVRIDLAGEALPMGRTYDFSGMQLISDEGTRIRASFPSLLDGQKSVDVKITIVKSEDGWRLDSPTY